MTIVEAARGITGGVDTHRDVHVAAALDPLGGLLGAFYALVLYARVAAERTGRPPEAIAIAIAERRGVDLGAS